MIGLVDPLSPESQALSKPQPMESPYFTPNNTLAEPKDSCDSLMDQRTHRTEEIILDSESSIIVEISDALSEKDKVKYTVRSITKLPDWKNDYSVVREHEEFIWLHSALEENVSYAAFIIPPPPPRPNFLTSQLKLQKLAQDEHNMTKEEFIKAKQDLEQEYLALFKKTVAMHEVYLQRLAAHPVIKNDNNLKLFLQYDKDMSVRAKNTKEVVGSIWKKVTTSADHLVLSGHRDVDAMFDYQRSYIVEYSLHINQAAHWAEKVVRLRKRCTEIYSNLQRQTEYMSRTDPQHAMYVHPTVAETFNQLRKVEMKSANDEELKLADTLSYFSRDTQAAKDLFYRRLRCLTNYENANKNLDRARAKSKDIKKHEEEQTNACKKYEEFTHIAKTEILDYKKRRVAAFVGNLKALVELEIKNEKAQIRSLKECLNKLYEVL